MGNYNTILLCNTVPATRAMESKSTTKQARKKPLKKAENPGKAVKATKAKAPKEVTKKRAREKETAIVAVADEDALSKQAAKPAGQLAKSIRCSQLWNRQNIAEAEESGGILLRDSETHTAGETAEGHKYTDLKEIRSSKKYAQGQQEVLQDQALAHLDNMEMMTELQEKRTVDLKTVCTYHAILASMPPQFAQIHRKPRESVICDTIHTYMHLPGADDSKLDALKKSLDIIAKKSKARFSTKEGMIEFIRDYTGDDYYTSRAGVFQIVV